MTEQVRATPQTMAPPHSVRWRVSAAWERHDRLRVVTLVAIGGLLLGAVMAVFGLPHADMHGPLHRYFGIMDPFCGGTRSVFYAMRGQWARSWEYNPVGIPLVLGAALLVLRHIVGMVSGRWLNPRVRVPRWFVATVITAAVVVLEINQQLHAALLMGP